LFLKTWWEKFDDDFSSAISVSKIKIHKKCCNDAAFFMSNYVEVY
jgi:hypothetical protein